MDIKLSKIFGTIWCVLVFSTRLTVNSFSFDEFE